MSLIQGQIECPTPAYVYIHMCIYLPVSLSLCVLTGAFFELTCLGISEAHVESPGEAEDF